MDNLLRWQRKATHYSMAHDSSQCHHLVVDRFKIILCVYFSSVGYTHRHKPQPPTVVVDQCDFSDATMTAAHLKLSAPLHNHEKWTIFPRHQHQQQTERENDKTEMFSVLPHLVCNTILTSAINCRNKSGPPDFGWVIEALVTWWMIQFFTLQSKVVRPSIEISSTQGGGQYFPIQSH